MTKLINILVRKRALLVNNDSDVIVITVVEASKVSTCIGVLMPTVI